MTGFFKKLWQSDTRKAFEEAMEFYNQRRYNEAVKAFEEILAQKGASSDVYYNLSAVYCSQSYHDIGFRDFLMGLFPQACNYFQKALDLQPGHIDLYQLIGICRNNMRDHEGAVEAFQFLLTIDHNRLAARINQGIVFYNLQLWDKAVQHHNEIIRDYPSYPDVHYRLGLALIGMDRTHEAHDALSRALALNPKYHDAAVKLALLKANFGHYDEANQLISMVEEQHPRDPAVHYARGAILFEQHDLQGAAAAFQYVLSLAPDQKEAGISLALTLVEMNDLPQAIDMFRKIKEMDHHVPHLDEAIASLEAAYHLPPQHPKPLNGLGPFFRVETVLELLKREVKRPLNIAPDIGDMIATIATLHEDDCALCEPILSYIQDYVAQHPDYPDLYHSLGLLNIRLRQYTAAEKAFRTAVLLNPDYLSARMNLFRMLKEAGKNADALLEAHEIMGRVAPAPDFYADLSEVCLNLGQVDAALDFAGKALKIDPHHAAAYLVQARTLERMGQVGEALVAVERCLTETTVPEVREAALALREEIVNSKK
ncbi:MAG: tetratricopeptide repeat protein [Deltaproteobacteria bacterium]|nr:tetratricopeptide repeat protein [Deltaproteobacteria bacterium]